MIRSIFHYIYCMPLANAIAICFTGAFVWCVAGAFLQKKAWQILNCVLTAVGFLAILFITILSRKPSENMISLIPFISFSKAKVQNEYYRTMLFNLLMFAPFSLGIAGVLPSKINTKKRFFAIILICLAVSIIIEIVQATFNLGCAETDDVIMNTLGALIGAVALLITAFFKKLRKKG